MSCGGGLMIKEKSCGAVVYKFINNELYILILNMRLGHVSIPKGHVENNETELETTLREIKEETNLDVTVDTNFRKTINYSPYEGISKDVVFFVAAYKDGIIKEQESEVDKAFWAPFKDAISYLTYQSDKDVVESAIEYILKEKRNKE